MKYLLLQLQLVFQHFPWDKQGPQRKNLLGCWGFDRWETHTSQISKQALNASHSLSTLHILPHQHSLPSSLHNASALRMIVEEMYVLLIEFGLSSFLCDVASILKVKCFPCLSNTSSLRLKIPHSLCCVPLVQLIPVWNVQTLAAVDFTIMRVASHVLANSYLVPCSDQDYQWTICEQFSLWSPCRKLYLSH